ncbi:7TM diverse intracellular signaling domain-containing protein [Oligoflexus tunisiensis]|uniref:7TM diverse intracellular signaling domain-containing protein n=1 Tax=Oligoflexus tunisiensis TaxID=708132 RepID=UPI00114C867C|nr:7TM diverse intracellular signaling domain-containing protein [Oligoflexus tunisiensis]
MKALFQQIFLLLGLLTSTGLAAVQPVLELPMLPEDESILIGRYVTFWERTKEVPDTEILQGLHDYEFKPSDHELPARGFITNNLWMRLVVNNPHDHSESIYLSSRYPMTDEMEFFQKDAAGNWQSEKKGDNHPRAGTADYRMPIFKLQVTPGSNVYYIKVQTRGSGVFPLYLSRMDALRHFQMQDSAILALLFGVMLTLILYNVFLTISFRSTTYLFYTLFLVCMTMTQISVQGVWLTILPGEIGTMASNVGFQFMAALAYTTAFLVTLSFLNMREHMPVFRWIYIAFIAFSFLMAPLTFIISYNVHVKILSSNLIVGSFIMMGSSSVAVLRGYRPAFAYSFAWLFMIINNILLALCYEGVVHNPFVIQYGNLPGMACEGILMSLALGDRINFLRAKADRTIHELNQQLQQHLVQVEALVDERTETIRTILDNVASGFLMIDRGATIIPGFTRSCHGFLGASLQEGQNLIKVLHLRSSVEKKFRMALTQVFEDQMPVEATLGQLPSHVLSHGKYLHIEAAGIRDKQGVLQHVLLTITDATELRKRKIEAQRNRSLLKILRDIEGFRQFVAYSHEAVQKLKDLQPDSQSLASREVHFILHTLKGNCLVFQLQDIARFLHQLEDQSALSSTEIEALEEQFKKFLTRYASLLRTPWGPVSHEKRVTDAQLESLQEIARTRCTPPLRQELEMWVHDVAAKPVRSVLHSMLNDARVVARKLRKDVELRVLDREVRIHSEAEEALIEQLLHVVRNAIVHGIEDDREAAHKPRQGFICLDFRELPEGLAISCYDDGQGFDRKVWEKEWINRGWPVEGDLSQMPLGELVGRISRGGFSTKDKVSLFAGRGIGMEALFAAVDHCQGTLEIQSEPGKGSRFEIFVPRPRTLRSVS